MHGDAVSPAREPKRLHSHLRANIGSIWVARRAGTAIAIAATVMISATAAH
jgi:hypothetical protein